MKNFTNAAESIDKAIEIVDAITKNAKVETLKPEIPKSANASKPKKDKAKPFQHFRESIEPDEIV